MARPSSAQARARSQSGTSTGPSSSSPDTARPWTRHQHAPAAAAFMPGPAGPPWLVASSQLRMPFCAIGVVDLQAYGLGLGVEAKDLMAHLAAPARLLHAAERH